MTRGNLTAISLAALVGAAFCVAPMESASAFTLNAPSLASPANGQIDKVQWRHGGGWRGGGWRRGGWGPGAIIGGLAAGALVGGYYGGYYGPGYYGYGPDYSDCWRDAWGRRRCY